MRFDEFAAEGVEGLGREGGVFGGGLEVLSMSGQFKSTSTTTAAHQTYLIMPQPHPIHQLLLSPRQAQNIPQCPNLQPIEILVHRILHERLKLQNALFNFQPCLGESIIAIFIFLDCFAFGAVPVCEAQKRWVGGEQPGFEGVGAAVEDFVYGVDYVVDE